MEKDIRLDYLEKIVKEVANNLNRKENRYDPRDLTNRQTGPLLTLHTG